MNPNEQQNNKKAPVLVPMEITKHGFPNENGYYVVQFKNGKIGYENYNGVDWQVCGYSSQVIVWYKETSQEHHPQSAEEVEREFNFGKRMNEILESFYHKQIDLLEVRKQIIILHNEILIHFATRHNNTHQSQIDIDKVLPNYNDFNKFLKEAKYDRKIWSLANDIWNKVINEVRKKLSSTITPKQQGKEEAVRFADWLNEHYVKYNNIWRKQFDHTQHFSTDYLYNIFKSETSAKQPTTT